MFYAMKRWEISKSLMTPSYLSMNSFICADFFDLDVNPIVPDELVPSINQML
jgi:hypothetical protein